MTSSDLAAFIRENGIRAEIVRPDAPTPTVEAAAAAVGTTPERIIKSVLFLVRDHPVLAIAGGLEPVDERAIAARFEVGRRQVKLAGAADVERVTGYPVGGVPPFGHPQPVSTLIDPAVLAQPVVYGGGGDHKTLIRLSPEEIRRVTGAEIVSLTGR
ncbi:MAG TPA: YbaK/EbsC family protein [Anaerolineales bacterium]|nr:YbaK/EbsC family protein [Anaerolineales bacterium]